MGSSEIPVTRHLWTDAVPRPGYANMAIDLSLLDRSERSGDTWLRLYRWQPSCLSFGRHEPAMRRYNLEQISRLGLDTVRRPTGGRAVWHARELTYALTGPIAQFNSPHAAYLEIHTVMREALGRVGVHGHLAHSGPAARLEAGACFSQPVGGEVVVDGRKIVGSAQLVRGTCLLQHGSIILEDSQGLVDQLKRGILSSASSSGTAATTIRMVDTGALAEAVAEEARLRWGHGWRRVEEADDILDGAARYFPQFQSPEWTWIR
jgi:lipoate-protein ligase A